MRKITWISGLGFPDGLDPDGELEIIPADARECQIWLDAPQAIRVIKLLADRFNLDIKQL